ncbi:putative AMS1-alpha-mannosidase [Acaromyces ingoldii]|uniref:alpha-mannosidase n=1 Tax=Acaromyces ingoldii TaxID=215250 RepID=A0A316YV69_9BASI|nr:putative AMS1-alpha-mannosidase [Acaromyces ingoldii]PWN91943.1 putative AMS1-alpha-mannosidase [Acaromyces ingoldii]
MAPPAYPLLSTEARHAVRRPSIRGVEERRLGEFIGGQYSNWNLSSVLFEGKTDHKDVIRLERWDPPAGTKPSFDEAKKQDYRKAEKGQTFGPSWSNHWLKLHINLPKEWRDKEWVELEFDPSCEAMIFDEHGLSLQGITGGFDKRRVDFPLPKSMRKGVLLYAEVTCNGLFGVENRQEGDPDPDRYFELRSADIVVKRPEAWHLLWDFQLLQGCVNEMPRDGPLQNKALWVANRIQDTFRKSDLSTIKECRKLAEEILGKGWADKGAKIYDEGNRRDRDDFALWSIGHTHIDSAWLWPFTATQQKVARSWSTQLSLMEKYPEFKFTASTAQQYKWLETFYPKLFVKVQEAVKKGTFVPIGATWVENDANLPSGEAFVRQFVHGQRYFESRFGKRSNVFWLPDTFGYNSQIPAIARGAGTDYFFTQKLSWSNMNRFPHNTMMWTGLDGTQIITHMTPVDNYDSQNGVNDILRGVRNNKNLGVQPTALHLFGWGDGGGGPSAPNLEALRRARAVYNNGYTEMPKVHSGKTAAEFFDNVRKITDNGERLPTWTGEVYLEFHRGVYTSHGSIKRWNRKLEIAMSQLEWTATLASIVEAKSYSYPKEDIDSLWESILLCQFHDVLPGSSIRLVYDDAEKIYASVAKRGASLLEKALSALDKKQSNLAIVNPLNIPRRELVWVPERLDAGIQKSSDGASTLVLMEDADACGLATLSPAPTSIMRNLEAVSVTEHANQSFTMSNGGVMFKVDKGRISSLQLLTQDKVWKELLPHGRTAGLSICEDYPPQFDAWETEIYSLQTEEEIAFETVRIAQAGPWRAALELQANFGKSSVRVEISLDALPATATNAKARDARSFINLDVKIDWEEKHRFLRFDVPTVLRADLASYETQFGITKRPTSRNTSWEAAKFEVCGHKFADLSEPSMGLALLTDSKYGYSVEGGLMRISLLKAGTYPDAHQDEGKHRFRLGIYPHLSSLEHSDVVHAGRIFNAPLTVALPNDYVCDIFGSGSRLVEGAPICTSAAAPAAMPVRLDNPGGSVILDTVKRGEEDFEYHGKKASGRKTVVCRLYESLGNHAKAVLSCSSLNIKQAKLCNLLEDEVDDNVDVKGGKIILDLRPFQIVTVKLVL